MSAQEVNVEWTFRERLRIFKLEYKNFPTLYKKFRKYIEEVPGAAELKICWKDASKRKIDIENEYDLRTAVEAQEDKALLKVFTQEKEKAQPGQAAGTGGSKAAKTTTAPEDQQNPKQTIRAAIAGDKWPNAKQIKDWEKKFALPKWKIVRLMSDIMKEESN